MIIIGMIGCIITLKNAGKGQEAADIGRWEVVGTAGNGRGTSS